MNARELFQAKFNLHFDVATSDIESCIRSDPKRSKADIEQDIAFLKDQHGERKMFLEGNDNRYQYYVPWSERERIRLSKLREKESSSAFEIVSSDFVVSDSSAPSSSLRSVDFDNDSHVIDPSFVLPIIRTPITPRPSTVLMKVPTDLALKTAGTAERYGMTLMEHTAILANVVASCKPVEGGSSASFVLSKSSTERKRSSVLVTKYNSIKSKFVDAIGSASNMRLIAHSDGKILMDGVGYEYILKDRFAVAVSSPDLNGNIPQLLGIPVTSSTSGADQSDTLYCKLNEWQCLDYLFGSCHDTTGSNVSPAVGTVMRLERRLGEEIMKFPCRRHIMELHAQWIPDNLPCDIGQIEPADWLPAWQREKGKAVLLRSRSTRCC